MFKFYRDGTERPRDNVIGHDRFCQQKVAVPRYRRRRAPSKRTQAEVDSAFELASIPSTIPGPTTGITPAAVSTVVEGGSRDSSIYNSTPTVCRNLTDSSKLTENRIGHNSNSRDFCYPASTPSTVQFHRSISGEYLQYSYNEREASTCSITRFFSSIAATLNCRQSRKTSVKYDANTDKSGSLHYEYSRLGDEAINSSTIMESDEAFIDMSPGIIRLEKAAAHRICMKYLDSMKGRYLLVDHLPDIGWRTNRLWYLVSDSTVRAERLLTITPCNPRCRCVNQESVKTIIEACHALRHPYVCPILDLKIIEAEAFGKQFVIVVTPVVKLGSLRDIFHRSQWTDRWDLKYNAVNKGGIGLTEIQIQRLSCHILEALLELRLKGLPPGIIGYHLHSGNVLIQHGAARFSALDNILFSHQSKKLPFITPEVQRNAEAIDSTAFAYMLFSMCSGYEITSPMLTSTDWSDIEDYEQVLEVLSYILKNPENQIPTLNEISKLDFYRSLDLRELRAPPPPSSSLISGPPVSAVHFLIQCLKSNRARRAQKSKSICEIMIQGENLGQPQQKLSSEEELQGLALTKRAYSASTPSIPKAVDETKESSSSSVSPAQLSTPPPDASITPTTHSSQLSVYWTPPNSITFQIESTFGTGGLKETAT